jgi:hypothetical protein
MMNSRGRPMMATTPYMPCGRPPFASAPDWRHRRALWLHHAGRRPRRADDGWVRQALRLVRRVGPGVAPKAASLPVDLRPLHAAWQIHQDSGALRWRLEAELLTPAPLAEIALACGLPKDTVEAYASVLFDVHGHLDAAGWIANHVLPRRAALGVDIKDKSGLLKLVAYRGGRIALESALRVLFPSGDNTPSDAQDGSPAALVERSLDLGCRLHLLCLCVPAEGSARGLLRIRLLAELSEEWSRLHAGLLELCSGQGVVRAWAGDLPAQAAGPPGRAEGELDDLPGRLGWMQQAVGHAWQAAEAGWAA